METRTEKQRRTIEAMEDARSDGVTLSEYAKARGLAIRALYDAIADFDTEGVTPRRPQPRAPALRRLAILVSS